MSKRQENTWMRDTYPVRILRSRRKTLSIQIAEGNVLVRAPMLAGDAMIDTFLRSHEQWIRTHLEQERKAREQAEEDGRLSQGEIRDLAEKALQVIPVRVAYFASRMGVTYGRITIRNQRTRWGSCSAAGNLNFNCLLMLCPAEVIDSVVVHELAHRKEMNHSPRFYEEVLKVFPEYHKWNRWLKENGPALIRRM